MILDRTRLQLVRSDRSIALANALSIDRQVVRCARLVDDHALLVDVVCDLRILACVLPIRACNVATATHYFFVMFFITIELVDSSREQLKFVILLHIIVHQNR